MNAQQLRNSILQEAIEGRLVPQDPNDEPASALLERIREEKRRLVKEGKLKKKDLVETPISEDEKPFEIPESWEWCRIGEYTSQITDFVASGSFASLRENVKYYSTKEYAILVRTKDFQNSFQTDLVYTDKHGYDFLSNSNLFGGELILPNIGASIGKVFIVPKLDYRMTLAPNSVMIRFYREEQRDWIYTIFSSNFGKKLLHDISSSTAQGKFNKTDFKNIYIPIPPLAEQHRIVARIEELMPKVEEYGKAQEALDKLNAELPEKLKKSILQEAIEGRLVPQDPNDEPASVLLDKIRKEKAQLVKEGKLKKKDLVETPISEDEKPFEIPESWEWCRLGWIGEWGAGATPAKGNPEYYSNGTIPWLRTGELNNGYVYDSEIKVTSKALEKCSLRMCKVGDVLIAMYGATIGKVAIAGIELTTNQACCACTPLFLYNKYLLYYLMASKKTFIEMGEGGAQPNISREKIVAFPFPLPPLSEQHRIVARIENLLGRIEML